MKKLSKKELNELKGGAIEGTTDGPVQNGNTITGCCCMYINGSKVIENINNIAGCTCNCKLPD